MKNIILVILLLTTFVLAACSRWVSRDRQLILADTLMQRSPDSALCILKNISVDKLATQADSAYYALLMTQARDKNYIVQTDDSLIRIAVRYYDVSGNTKMQAKAHYYYGCVFRDMNRQVEAVREYLIAAPLTEKINEKRQLGLVYNNIGYIYSIQNFDEKADSLYQLVEDLAVQQKDSALWAEALYRQGCIAIKRDNGNCSVAEQKLLDALSMADVVGHNGLKANISAGLSSLYSQLHQREKALYYAKQNLSLRKDISHAYQAFLILGDAYYKCK